MASALIAIRGTVINVEAFSGMNCFFSKLMDHGEKEHKRPNLAPE